MVCVFMDSAMCRQAREVCRSLLRECQECQCNLNSLLTPEATTTCVYFIPNVSLSANRSGERQHSNVPERGSCFRPLVRSASSSVEN